MHQDHFARIPRLFVLSSLVLIFGSTSSALADTNSSGPSMATSGSLDDHEAESVDLGSFEAESGEMVPAEPEDPDTITVEAEQADIVESSLPAAHVVESIAIDDLGTSKPDVGFEVIDDGRLARGDEKDLTAEQLLARRQLEHAQANATAARTRYGDMMRDDYPRGAARERIVHKRDATMEALGRARSAFGRAMGN